jgi:hypothetical protein
VTSIQRWAALAFLLAIFGAGVGVGYVVFAKPTKQAEETPLPESRQDDGSLLLGRDKDAATTLPKPEIPKGHTRVRTSEVTVAGGLPIPSDVHGQGTSGPQSEPGVNCQTYTCPPVRVRLDLLRADDGTYRVQASSDTEILDGVDVPVSPLGSPYKWAAGYSRINGEHGVAVHRDIGRVRIGVGVSESGSRVGEVLWRF